MGGVLFLDMDGVLNGHEWDFTGASCSLARGCVREFNRIVDFAKPRIVLSSAWRYLILEGAMTVSGFHAMLRTHGVSHLANFVGHTVADEVIPSRGSQISQWLSENGNPQPYVVLDDLDLGISVNGHPFVQTRKDVGLTRREADAVIEMLTGSRPVEAIASGARP